MCLLNLVHSKVDTRSYQQTQQFRIPTRKSSKAEFQAGSPRRQPLGFLQKFPLAIKKLDCPRSNQIMFLNICFRVPIGNKIKRGIYCSPWRSFKQRSSFNNYGRLFFKV